MSLPPAEHGELAEAAGITDSLLPPPALPAVAEAEQPGSPAIPAKHPAGAAQPPGQQQQASTAASPLKVALRGSPGRKGSPGASLSPAGSRQQQQLCASSPSALWASGGGGGGCAGSPKRGPAVLTSHLTKELVSLQDELLVKTDLADALACKVSFLPRASGRLNAYPSIMTSNRQTALIGLTLVVNLCTAPA